MRISNKRAHFDFEIRDKFEAGIQLTGAETKAVRLGHADLTGSFVKILGNEAYLVNSKIFPYKYARPEGYDENRTRKLLLHKKEIITLKSKMDGEGLSVVPMALYEKGDFFKIELGIGKGKKTHEKRRVLKEKALERDIEREIA